MKKKIIITIASLFLLLTQASAQMTVTLSVSPNDTICQYQTVTFTAVVSGCAPPFTAQWDINGIPVLVGPLIFTYSNASATGDCISCTVSSGSATCIPNPATSNTICLYVIPNQPPSVTIVSIATNPVCVGSLVVFTAIPVDAGGSCATYTWYVNGVPDLSSTASVFNYIPLTAGLQSIYCEVHSCDTCDFQPPVNNPTAVSNSILVNVVVCTGVNEIQNNSSIKIYPNPTDGEINLYWENPSGVKCEIFISDYVGKIISEYRTAQNSLSIEDAALKSGVYFVTIKTGEKLFRSPVMVY
ncbi:MAG TPA: T9SS type A sorting domain-containing protein [Bacteroidia bacterium]|nr:T9SS type A sorting domain-containing protein [Bacteroidia bacterium]